MSFNLKTIAITEFGVPQQQPEISPATYEARCKLAYERAGADWLVVYADREHFANIAFLSAFEPRFEEALLLLGPQGKRIFVTGNECFSYTAISRLPAFETLLCQSLSLLAQDRSQKSDIVAVLREAGLKKGDTVGLVGWKYFEPSEWSFDEPAFYVPDFLPKALKAVTGGLPVESTHILMGAQDGLRTVVDADQIAAFEWAAARASAALWRVVTGIRPGDNELTAASRALYAGEPMNCHMMMTTQNGSGPVIGLSSPSGRIISEGDGASTAISYWGGLSSRAGLISAGNDDFLKPAQAYMEGLAAWYGAADTARGGDIHEAVVSTLARGGLKSALNPGHLTGHDEWINSPVRPGSEDRIVSGMPFQVDIIPVPMPDGWALNCEDAVTFADAGLRAELEQRYPEVAGRIAARRDFIRREIGVDLSDNILPLSSTPLCLPPFWLASDRLLARG